MCSSLPGDNGKLKLRVVGGDEEDVFFIHSTGNLCLNKKLDRERQSSYNLTMTAIDCVQPVSLQLTSTAQVTVVVEDVNDNAPVFVSPKSVNIPEDTLLHSVIMTVHAEDEDAGSNGKVLYYLNNTSGGIFNMFHVEQLSGALTVENPLDYENKKEFSLLIEARDSGLPPFSSFSQIYINITDVNDNLPQFTQSEYRCEVFENSPPSGVCDVLAVDADSGNYSTVQYNITEGNTDNFFIIDLENGLLSTTGSLDREDIPEFNLTVEAAELNNPLHKDRTTVIITVLDRNDNAPRFSQIFYTELPEDVPVGHSIIQVTSTDDDTDANAVINYFLTDQSDDTLFSIDLTTGYITVEGRLDREVQDHYILKVNANDSTLVHVSVIDTNDPPVFTPTSYTANITEDSPAGTSVVTVSALDQDSILDWNRFFFSIENGNTNFSFAIDPSSGLISVNSPLDRELWPVYNLTVTATDNGSPPATGTTTVIVTIGDVNDNAPKLTTTGAQVKENQPEGTVVTRLNASDSDLPPNQGPFTYSLLNRSTGFLLTPDGLLLTTQTIDREQASTYQLLVVTGDAGVPSPLSSTATLHIRVMDENDNPSFPRNIFIEVKYFGMSGVHCEEHSYGFEELSFMEFPSLDRRTNLVSLEFATVQRNSLLLYNPRGSSSRDFLALEILDGAVHLSYDLGSGPVRLQTHKHVADGAFHSVTVRRIGNVSFKYVHTQSINSFQWRK
uniref:Uncharacterized protein n=1 Tax=Amphiprion percula TaxID=161767 RepID=A0A3P8SL33_AMPPE